MKTGEAWHAKLLQLYPPLSDPMDISPPPLSMGFSRQEYWSGLPCPPPGDLPDRTHVSHVFYVGRLSLYHQSHVVKAGGQVYSRWLVNTSFIALCYKKEILKENGFALSSNVVTFNSFNDYLLSTCYVPDTILRIGDIALIKAKSLLSPWLMSILVGEDRCKQTHLSYRMSFGDNNRGVY